VLVHQSIDINPPGLILAGSQEDVSTTHQPFICQTALLSFSDIHNGFGPHQPQLKGKLIGEIFETFPHVIMQIIYTIFPGLGCYFENGKCAARIVSKEASLDLGEGWFEGST
jgi:hypothetical protein